MKRVLLVGLALAGCGSPSGDLFEVERTGADAGANLTLLVSDGGSVRCDDAQPQPIGTDRLLEARELARDLEPQAALGLELEPEEGSNLRYRVRLEDGTITFADNSDGRTREMNRIVAFTSSIAEQVCKVDRR